jgi:hypothetical protein
VAISQADKAMEYANYAKHRLETARKIPDRESRVIHREMAAEWFKLADQAAGEAATTIVASSNASKKIEPRLDRRPSQSTLDTDSHHRWPMCRMSFDIQEKNPAMYGIGPHELLRCRLNARWNRSAQSGDEQRQRIS